MSGPAVLSYGGAGRRSAAGVPHGAPLPVAVTASRNGSSPASSNQSWRESSRAAEDSGIGVNMGGSSSGCSAVGPYTQSVKE